MHFREIASRLTGISTPIFGLSWEPPTADVEIARRVIAYLEDRRVLYTPWQFENPDEVVESVIQIRQVLTEAIGRGRIADDLVVHLRAMRSGCRHFMDEMASYRDGYLGNVPWYDQPPPEIALGELRLAVGLHVAQIAVKYGIDVEEPLSSIFPAADDDGSETSEERRLQRSRSARAITEDDP